MATLNKEDLLAYEMANSFALRYLLFPRPEWFLDYMSGWLVRKVNRKISRYNKRIKIKNTLTTKLEDNEPT